MISKLCIPFTNPSRTPSSNTLVINNTPSVHHMTKQHFPPRTRTIKVRAAATQHPVRRLSQPCSTQQSLQNARPRPPAAHQAHPVHLPSSLNPHVHIRLAAHTVNMPIANTQPSHTIQRPPDRRTSRVEDKCAGAADARHEGAQFGQEAV